MYKVYEAGNYIKTIDTMDEVEGYLGAMGLSTSDLSEGGVSADGNKEFITVWNDVSIVIEVISSVKATKGLKADVSSFDFLSIPANCR